MTCLSCRAMMRSVSSPDELKAAIHFLQQAVAEEQVKYLGRGKWGDPLENYGADPKFGDFVHNFFECPQCSLVIELWAETFQGASGGIRINHDIRRVIIDE